MRLPKEEKGFLAGHFPLHRVTSLQPLLFLTVENNYIMKRTLITSHPRGAPESSFFYCMFEALSDQRLPGHHIGS